MPGNRPEEIDLGLVARPHGVRGAVQVKLHDPSSSTIERCSSVTLRLPGGERRRARVRVEGRTSRGVWLRLEGVDTPEQASELRGASVLVPREAVGRLEEGQYLYADLQGCLVLDEEGRRLGEVASVFEAGASDVLVVRDGESERMIPLVDEWIRQVDVEGRVIRVLGGDQWEPHRA